MDQNIGKKIYLLTVLTKLKGFGLHSFEPTLHSFGEKWLSNTSQFWLNSLRIKREIGLIST